MRRRSFLLSIGAAAAGCRGGGALCFAAVSTRDALGEVGRGRPVRFAWGGSGDLARQIVAGAPAELFLSADVARVEPLQRAGLVAARRELLSNRLVVVVRRDDQRSVAKASDLAALGRVAVGDPAHVPAGAYAREWLERAGAWSAVGPRVAPTLDVRAALAAVSGGAADAAIVYRTDARIASDLRVAFEPEPQPSIVYPLVTLARAGAEARAFAEHLAGPEARAVFARHGFSFP
jgi:molybdate transport system substrate-binding protein